MNYFTSDMHYFHKNIIAYCNRPFTSVETMNEIMIANWTYIVEPSDTVYVIGDVSFGSGEQTKEILSRLPGKKILIVGNHDRKHKKSWWKSAGFDEVVDTMSLMLGTYEVALCHFPSGDPKNGLYDVESQVLLLCGHVHTNWKMKGKMINVGVDVWDFTPVADHRIMRLLEGW